MCKRCMCVQHWSPFVLEFTQSLYHYLEAFLGSAHNAALLYPLAAILAWDDANIIGVSNFGEKFLAFYLTFFRISYNGYTPPPAPQPGTLQVRGFHWRLQCSEGVQNDPQWIFRVLYYSAPSIMLQYCTTVRLVRPYFVSGY